MANIKFIDIYTPSTPPSNWTGLPMVIHKATQGTFNKQAAYPTRRAAFPDSAVWGSYHAFMGNVDATQQARFYLEYAKPAPGDVIALDLEQFDGSWAGKSKQAIASMASVFMRYCRAAFPENRVGLYCNRSDYAGIVRAYGVPVFDFLWIATLDNTRPTNIPWLFCQYAVINNIDWNEAKFADAAAIKRWSLGLQGGGVSAEGGSDMSMVTLEGGRFATVVRGTDKRIYARVYSSNGEPTSDWKRVGQTIAGSGVDACTRTGSDLWITTLDAPDGSILVISTEDAANPAVAVTQDMGGKGLGSAPGIAAVGPDLYLTVAGVYPQAGRVYLKRWNGTDRTWSDWKDATGVAG